MPSELLLRNGVEPEDVAPAIAAVEHVPEHSPWMRVVWYGVPSALLLYGAAAAEDTGTFRMPAALCFVGDICYSLCLAHGLVLAGLGRKWWVVLPASKVSNLLACLFLSGAAIGFAALSHRLVERPLQSLLRRNPLTARAKRVPVASLVPSKFAADFKGDIQT